MRGALAIIGAGRVGRALGRRLHELGWKIGAVVTRNEASARKAARFIGAGKAHSTLSREVLASRLILISTPDDAVAAISKELARVGAEELRGKVVLHTSGALSSSILQNLRNCGAAVGSMHPLQSFSGVAVPSLEGKVFAIEGDPAAVRLARQLVRALGGLPVQLAAGTKPLYHAAASFAAGHVLAIEEASARLLMLSGMKRNEAVRALLQLTRQVLENFERLGPRTAWTGPLARGDRGVIAAHFAAMKSLPPEFSRAYTSLNDLASLVLSADSSGALAGAHHLPRTKFIRARVHSSGGKV
ncbi:MAG TPA: Rossmann-like and DUF2520 domain-containing protein [Candidatus Acidoferrum sp.]|jgi:predicted short-subunit dehydrogenase-like oxidoreductase (DUF2520 family)